VPAGVLPADGLRFADALLPLAGRVVVPLRDGPVRGGGVLRVAGRDEERDAGALASEKSLNSKKLMVLPRAACAE
jgi:hypothetical protein